MAGRISALDEKLAALGQTQEDYLPSEIEKFKDATGYEEFLDVDPQAIREAIENPDQSHVDEMLAFAEQDGREYEAELSGQAPEPSPDALETGETVRTPRGTFYVTDMSREQMEAAGYGFHHQSDDGKYLIMGNGSHSLAFVISLMSVVSTWMMYPSIAIFRRYAPYRFVGSWAIFSSMSRFSSSVTQNFIWIFRFRFAIPLRLRFS